MEPRIYTRRSFLRIGALGAASGLLVACQGAGSSQPAAKPTTPAAPKTSKVITARLASAHEPGHTTFFGQEEFARIVKEKTNGEIEIRVVPSGQLGVGRAAMEAVQAGTLEFAHMVNANISTYEQSRLLFDLPYIFRDAAHMAKVMDGPIGKESVDIVQKKLNVTLLMEGIYEGPRVTYNRVRLINSPKDFQGLKIRVMENPINVATFKAMGANPVPIAFTELYLALQQGTVDGAEGPQATILTSKHYEAAKFVSRTNHFCSPVQIIAGTKWLESLSADHRKAITDAARDALLRQRENYDKALKDAEAQLAKEGVQLNSPDLAPFQQAMEPVWADYQERVGGKQRIQAVIDTK